MKKLIPSLLAGMMLLSTAAHAADKPELHVYVWDTYVADSLFKKFEAETGIKVITDVYSSNDTLLAKLVGGGSYDIIAPTGNYVKALVDEKLVQPMPEELKALAEGMIKNVQHPSYDADYSYTLPLFIGTTSYAVNTKLTKGEEFTTWKQFFERPAGEAASIGVLDDIGTVANLASLALGKPYCDNSPETFKAIQELLTKQKPWVKIYGATGYFERLAANEVSIQMAWNGDTYKTRQQNADIKYVYPTDGIELWVDNLAIPKSAKNLDAAKKFIAFVLKPENMAEYSKASGNIPSIAAAAPLLPEAMKTAPELNIPEGVKTEISIACPAEVTAAYTKIWEKLTQ